MTSEQTRALILRHLPDREHDRLLVILTEAGSQMRVRARGTKKSVSKLGGSLEPLMEVDLHLAHGRTLEVVTGSVIHDRFLALRQDVVKIVGAQWLLELIERISKPDQASHEMYSITLNALHELGRASDRAGFVWLTLLRSAWLLLLHEGFAPNLERCAACGQSLDATNTSFDAHRGFVHQHEAGAEAIKISAATLNFLHTKTLPTDVRDVFKQVHSLVESLIHNTFDQPLRSDRVFQRVIRQEQLSEQRRRATL